MHKVRGGNGASDGRILLSQAAAAQAMQQQKAELINAEIRNTARAVYCDLISKAHAPELLTAENFRSLARVAAKAAPFLHEALGLCQVNEVEPEPQPEPVAAE